MPFAAQLQLQTERTDHGFQSKNIALLTDDSKDPHKLPTRKHIMDAMYWLVNGAKADDSLFFHCPSSPVCSPRLSLIASATVSGHGQQVRDREGDEVDGYDEGMSH
jgi:hypothetical protein